MPKVRRVLLHNEGPLLWPGQRELSKVLRQRDTTPDHIWQTTYQLKATSPGGSAYKREWWEGGLNRYQFDPRWFQQRAVRRWISFDTAFNKEEMSAYSVGIVGELLDTWDVAIRDVHRRHVSSDELPDFIAEVCEPYAQDDLLAGVVIEAKASGITAMQTIRASSRRWLADLIEPYTPIDDKPTRYRNTARWCKLGFVKFPFPSEWVPWLAAFQGEIFEAPNSRFLDQADAFAQLVDWLSGYFELALDARERAAALPH